MTYTKILKNKYSTENSLCKYEQEICIFLQEKKLVYMHIIYFMKSNKYYCPTPTRLGINFTIFKICIILHMLNTRQKTKTRQPLCRRSIRFMLAKPKS